MEKNNQIGIGIVTYNRPHLLKKLLNSLPEELRWNTIVVNDGKPLNEDLYVGEYVQNEGNFGVGRSKNICLEYWMKQKFEHIFLIEDDIYIKNPAVFEKYIEASEKSGIQHFNYSQHGLGNKKYSDPFIPDIVNIEPNPKITVDYGNCPVSFYPNCVGAFSYYSLRCLETVGLIDERFYNACEHVEHTYRIIQQGMHPSFWWFADIANSWEYLGDEPWSREESTISGRADHDEIVREADETFYKIYGMTPPQIPHKEWDEVKLEIKQIVNTYAIH